MTDTKNIRGFTLIELIAVLIIIGVISIGIYSLLANIVNGFNHTRYVTDYTENLQIALTRITHEVANINTTKTYTISQSSITYYYGSDSNTSNISFSGSNIHY
jgi:prepilin-type N-terminal cleavage/methylation domain-containing protein